MFEELLNVYLVNHSIFKVRRCQISETAQDHCLLTGNTDAKGVQSVIIDTEFELTGCFAKG